MIMLCMVLVGSGIPVGVDHASCQQSGAEVQKDQVSNEGEVSLDALPEDPKDICFDDGFLFSVGLSPLLASCQDEVVNGLSAFVLHLGVVFFVQVNVFIKVLVLTL